MTVEVGNIDNQGMNLLGNRRAEKSFVKFGNVWIDWRCRCYTSDISASAEKAICHEL